MSNSVDLDQTAPIEQSDQSPHFLLRPVNSNKVAEDLNSYPNLKIIDYMATALKSLSTF